MDPKPVRDKEFYLENIIFLVEDTLFKVPRYGFEPSGIFAAIFTLPSGDNKIAEGHSDENPFKLEGITKLDFTRFLRCLYPSRTIPVSTVPNAKEWTSVLRLSMMWDFPELRQMAINGLSTQANLITKVVLARQYKIPKWLFAGYSGLVKRVEPISVAEAKKLGLDTAIRIFHIREARLSRQPVFRGISDTEFEKDIRRAFAKELNEGEAYI